MLDKLFLNFCRRLFDCLLLIYFLPNWQDWGFSLQETLPYRFFFVIPQKNRWLTLKSRAKVWFQSEIGIWSRKFLVGNYSSSTVNVIVKPIPLSQRLRVCIPRGMSWTITRKAIYSKLLSEVGNRKPLLFHSNCHVIKWAYSFEARP